MIPPYEAPTKFAHGLCDRVRRGFYIFHNGILRVHTSEHPQVPVLSKHAGKSPVPTTDKAQRVEGQIGTTLRPGVLHDHGNLLLREGSRVRRLLANEALEKITRGKEAKKFKTLRNLWKPGQSAYAPFELRAALRCQNERSTDTVPEVSFPRS